MRTKGSCRFEPYFKIEIWNRLMHCWNPIQRSYPTQDDAIKAAPAGLSRVQKITMDGVTYSQEITK